LALTKSTELLYSDRISRWFPPYYSSSVRARIDIFTELPHPSAIRPEATFRKEYLLKECKNVFKSTLSQTLRLYSLDVYMSENGAITHYNVFRGGEKLAQCNILGRLLVNQIVDPLSDE
jgi:hypothetical protein